MGFLRGSINFYWSSLELLKNHYKCQTNLSAPTVGRPKTGCPQQRAGSDAIRLAWCPVRRKPAEFFEIHWNSIQQTAESLRSFVAQLVPQAQTAETYGLEMRAEVVVMRGYDLGSISIPFYLDLKPFV